MMQRLATPRLVLLRFPAAACFVAAALSAVPSAAQLYTPYAQERSLEVRADAQVPPQTSAVVTDGRREESMELGGFDRSLSAAAAAGPGPGQPPYASSGAVARQAVAFTPTSITGTLSTEFVLDEAGGWTGGASDALFATEFRAEQSVPLRLTGRGVIRSRGGYFVLLSDLDTEDPHGGPLGLFGVGMSMGGSDESPYEFSTTLQAGHRYRFSVTTETDWEILRNPPVIRSGALQGEFTFALIVPEPTALAGLLPAALCLLRRPRHRAAPACSRL